MRNLSVLFLVCLSLLSYSQAVTHGPIVGGVTDSSARVFIRTDVATAFTIELSASANFSTIATSVTGSTNAGLDNTAIIELDGLISNKKYYLRISIGGNPSGDVARFETFYSVGTAPHQVFLTGAEINGLADSDTAIFVRATTENAKAFIQMGNWGYPDGTACFDIYYGAPPTSWASTYSNVQSIYKQRYSSSNSGAFIKSLALDYVYDDHDFMNEKSGKSECLGWHINATDDIYGKPQAWSQPVQARLNLLQGYQQLFPGYTLRDSAEGLYHSFRSGNAEFFVLDVRSMRGPNVKRVDTVGTTSNWQYVDINNSHLLGANQMVWLKSALANSTATWKFIVTAVPFNMGNRLALDTLIKLGGANVPYWNPSIPCYPFPLPTSAFCSTNNFADLWAGYKADGDSVLNFVFSNNIKNVFVLSGHTGTVGLDDGVNSGLPELMSANMKQTNSQDALTYQKFMGFSVWDLGGSGLCSGSNFNTTYGKVEVFNDDSIRLSAIDQTGAEVAGADFYVNAAYKYNAAYTPNRLVVAVADIDSVGENDTVSISVLANDLNPGNNTLYANVLSNPTHGTLLVNSNNTLTYIPDTGYYGIDTFNYTACNRLNSSCANCSAAKVTVNVLKTVASSVRELGKTQLKIYPNPAQSVLFVEVPTSHEVCDFVIMNDLGESLIKQTFTGKTEVDISKIPPGNYYYDLRNKASGASDKGKLSVVR